MTHPEEIAALELRIRQEQEKRDIWRAVGPQEKYIEAFDMVTALELQLEHKIQQCGS